MIKVKQEKLGYRLDMSVCEYVCVLRGGGEQG